MAGTVTSGSSTRYHLLLADRDDQRGPDHATNTRIAVDVTLHDPAMDDPCGGTEEVTRAFTILLLVLHSAVLLALLGGGGRAVFLVVRGTRRSTAQREEMRRAGLAAMAAAQGIEPDELEVMLAVGGGPGMGPPMMQGTR